MTVRWGVVGTGGIADRFADAMTMVDDGEIVAVSSRTMERASAFADRHGIPRRYGDDDALASDPDVDAVYIATPNQRHEADTIRHLEAGRHVLCEKPLALNAAEVERMVAAARAAGVFLMEAVWSRFLPSYRILGDLLGEGRIGEPLLVEADFGFRAPVDPSGRHFDLALGGGALLDLGVYPLQLCTLVLGPPDRVVADAVVGATGVDEHLAAVLHHPGEALGVIKTALRVPMVCEARIAGTEGWIDLPAFMHCPESLSVGGASGPEHFDASYEGDGLRFEIAEVHRCLAEGRTESATMPLSESLVLARLMDDIRAQVGVVFPGEGTPTD